jgi:hypothetical protein
MHAVLDSSTGRHGFSVGPGLRATLRLRHTEIIGERSGRSAAH